MDDEVETRMAYRELIYENIEYQQMQDVIKTGICVPGGVTICCPEPVPKLGMDYFLGHLVSDKSVVDNCSFPQVVDVGKSYTIKTLPSYANDYNSLKDAIEEHGVPCENGRSDS